MTINKTGITCSMLLVILIGSFGCSESFWYGRHLKEKENLYKKRLEQTLSTGAVVTNESISGQWTQVECKSNDPKAVEHFNQQKIKPSWEFSNNGKLIAKSTSPEGEITTKHGSYLIKGRKVIFDLGDKEKTTFWAMIKNGNLVFLDFDGCEFIFSKNSDQNTDQQ